MDFWARQAGARRHSRWLLGLFALAVLAVVTAVNVVVLTCIAIAEAGQPTFVDMAWLTDHPRAVAITTLLVLGFIAIANLYKTASLAAGGGVVARALGGMRVQADTQDPLQRRLLNVVEEMAIASGVPVPAVYVLEQEDNINAFAAGHTPANAAIAVTRGALAQLDRAELQGVIGHEFSHILNGDMRLNIRVMGLLFGLLAVAVVGRTLLTHLPRGGGRRRGGGLVVLAILGLVVMVIGYVGVFFGRLLQAAVSRQREVLADASSVQFTRESAGLCRALLKIGQVQGSRLHHPDTEEIAHMLFAPGLTRWFATHPPLAERIQALDPSFDAAESLRLEVRPQPLGVTTVVVGERAPESFSDAQRLRGKSLPLDPAAVPGLVANPGAHAVGWARVLRESLPSDLLVEGDRATHALAALLALVLSGDESIRHRQLQKISAQLGGPLATRVTQQAGRIAGLRADQRLPLLGRLVPVLRQLPAVNRRAVVDCLTAVSRSGDGIGVFDYALCSLARVYLVESLEPRREARRVRLGHSLTELQLLFSTLAARGHAQSDAAAAAFAQGVSRLSLQQSPSYRPIPGWAAGLDRALRCLDGLPPGEKAGVVEGLAAVIVHDGEVSVEEVELLRAICALLHCPLPPLGGRAV